MTTITIDLPDEQAAALKARASEEGLTLEGFVARRIKETADSSEQNPLSLDAAIEHILDLQMHVKPDPEGWSIRDYINHGRP